MTISVLVTLAALSVATADILPPQHGQRVVCYMSITKNPFDNTWFNASDAKPAFHLCTHIIFPCVVLRGLEIIPYENGYNTTENIRQLISERTELFPYLKILLGVGFIQADRKDYAWMAETAAKRSLFVQNVLDFVMDYKFDGVDFGWNFAHFQYDYYTNNVNQVLLVKELRREFDRFGLSVSISCITLFDGTEIGVDNTGLSANAHFITLGTAQHDGFNKVIERYISLDIPPEKINFAIMGRGLLNTLKASGDVRDLDVSSTSQVSYHLMCQLKATGNVTEDVDFTLGQSYYFFRNMVARLDNPKIIELKISYALSKSLGGVGFYALDGDDYRGECGAKYPMLREIDRNLVELSPNLYKDIFEKLEENGAKYFWSGMTGGLMEENE